MSSDVPITITIITITRAITEDGDQVWYNVEGDDALVTVLGMLELSKDTAIRTTMSDDE